MAGLRFEWDPEKAAANIEKHGVSFDEASTVFADERALLIDDPENFDDEDRLKKKITIHSMRRPSRTSVTSPRKPRYLTRR